jgi:hypothetical protein
MGFLDKAKAAAEQATTRVKEGVDDVQAKRSLSQAYEQLGQTTYELIDKGELTHAGPTAKAEDISGLRERLADGGTAAASPPPPADAPPPPIPT